MLRALGDAVCSFVYPQQCRVCEGTVRHISDGVACEGCWSETRTFTGNEVLCEKCGAFFYAGALAGRVRCRQCDGHCYDAAAALGVYEKALAASIVALKSQPHLPGRLRQLIKTTSIPAAADIIIPVPLSRQRSLERGYNPAEMIARSIGRRHGLPVDVHSLSRKLHTPIHRIGMDDRARELSVMNAFEVVRPKLVAGRNVLLVDDVLTSGATASACARVLKKKGAARVDVFTLARAIRH